MEANLHAARLQLRTLPQERLLAEAERFMVTAAVNHNLLSQAMRRIAELELKEAVRSIDARQQQLSAEGLQQRPRWPWSRQGS
jgi:UDP-galactopyranose mutase